MANRHSRAAILEAAVDVLAARGVAGLSFASVGAALGIPDRTVVYYFPTKADLLRATVGQASMSLRALLLEAFGTGPETPEALVARALPVLTSDRALPWMRIYLELVGRAAGGDQLHRSLAAEIAEAWIGWITGLVDGVTEERRRAGAIRVVAEVDGRVLLAVLGVAPPMR